MKLWGDTYDKPYVASLRSKIKTYGQRKQVFLCGTIKDMDAVWKETNIFAFPSHHEGFPLALSEALSCGILAVGYRSCAAVNEIIVSGENGLLCEDGAEPLSEALGCLMDDRIMLCRTYGEAARSMAEKYYAEKVWEQWEGFPLALTEAMASGLPADGLKSCHAVAELIENEKSGFLVDNTKEALAAALERLMNDPTLCKRMGKEARHAMDAYAPDVIWGKWEELLIRIVSAEKE